MENSQTDLKNKAIDIKGKKYVLVSDRIIFFNENYKKGSITTDIIKNEDKEIIIKATVIPDVTIDRRFSAYSQAIKGDGYINETSALENAETSAIGRALGFMGIGVIDSIASVDEITKATNTDILQKAKDAKIKEIFVKLKESKTLEEANKLKPIIATIYGLLTEEEKNGISEFFENLK